MLEYKAIEREVWTLTEEGRELADSASHEARVFEAVPAGEEGITIPELQVLSLNPAT
jgi:phenylalanyl-tRNA synthetase alpha chain